MSDDPRPPVDGNLYLLRELDSVNRRIDGLDARVTSLDEHGSRGLAGLQVQMSELSKDIGVLEKGATTLTDELRRLRSGRWTTFLAYAALVAPIYVFLVVQAISRG